MNTACKNWATQEELAGPAGRPSRHTTNRDSVSWENQPLTKFILDEVVGVNVDLPAVTFGVWEPAGPVQPVDQRIPFLKNRTNRTSDLYEPAPKCLLQVGCRKLSLPPQA